MQLPAVAGDVRGHVHSSDQEVPGVRDLHAAGRLRLPKMRVGKCKIVFDYGCHEVDIRFRLFGKVSVVSW